MVGMTPDITVTGPFIIRIAALDATTGANVANVNVSSAAILAFDVSDQGFSLPTPTIQLIGGSEA